MVTFQMFHINCRQVEMEGLGFKLQNPCQCVCVGGWASGAFEYATQSEMMSWNCWLLNRRHRKVSHVISRATVQVKLSQCLTN
jgi:hypothetical protein